MVNPTWTERKLSLEMKLRYTHTVMHNLALGRGPLRVIVSRSGDCLCRHGCGVSESLEHFVFGCIKVREGRQRVRSILSDEGLDFTLEHVFNCKKARNGLETMIGLFFEVFDVSK